MNLIYSFFSPNLITLIGFFCVLIPHLWLFYMFPEDLQGDIPCYLCLITGVLHLFYMVIDILLSKQNKKIKINYTLLYEIKIFQNLILIIL